jgi:uncharacterized membrane protein YqiK
MSDAFYLNDPNFKLRVNMRVNGLERSKITKLNEEDRPYGCKVTATANDMTSDFFSSNTVFVGRSANGGQMGDAHRYCYNQWHDHFVAVGEAAENNKREQERELLIEREAKNREQDEWEQEQREQERRAEDERHQDEQEQRERERERRELDRAEKRAAQLALEKAAATGRTEDSFYLFQVSGLMGGRERLIM